MICLGAAILLTVWGHFFLPREASPLWQILFWLFCFSITFVAIVIALVDLVAVRRETRAEKRALLEKTLHDLEADIRRQNPERR